MLNDVKKLYDLGFAIHLLRTKSKMPIEKKWSTGPKKSWDFITKNYRPGHNFGIRLGSASNIDGYFLAVIDCDVKSKSPAHLKEMNKKLSELVGIPTPSVVSGRGNGSRHLYIKTKAPIKPFRFSQSADKVEVMMPSVTASKNDLMALGRDKTDKGLRLRAAWEISVMGEGQQVVIPPSIHPDSNKAYYWVNSPKGVNDIPLLGIAVPPGLEKSDKKKLEDFKVVPVDLVGSSLNDDMVALIISGDGCSGDKSASLYSSCLAMCGSSFSDDEILSVLTDTDYYLGEVGYRHGNTSSRKAAAKWVHDFSLVKARGVTGVDQYFNDDVIDSAKVLDDDAVIAQEKEIIEATPWQSKILRNKDDGRPLNLFVNLRLIIENASLEKIIAHNEFSIEDLWLIDTPWGSKKNSIVNDVDSIRIKNWLAHSFRLEPSKEKIEEVLLQLSNENSFHPVREYLDGLLWDGTPRLGTWLKKYLRAEGPTDYLKEVGTKTLVAMVARIYEPGIKFDSVLILEGLQGIGKSSTARILAGDKWFSDSDLNIGDKDSVVNMQGIWVYELGELSAMSRFDVNRLKEFISRSTDKIRPPYGRRMQAYPRQNIFIGTTNNDEYLKDQTGNRRYWPVKCSTVRMKELEKDRDQLLAEAKDMYTLGENLWISDHKLKDVIATEQAKRVEFDDKQDTIEQYLLSGPENFNAECFRISDLRENCPGMDTLRDDRNTQMRLANMLKNLGYKKTRKMVGKVNASWWSK